MRNLRPRTQSSQNKQGVSGRSCRNDFISQMPDEMLLMILCHLRTKDAVVTCCVSTRWKFLWRSLNVLNFDGDETLKNMRTYNLAVMDKFVDQVNSVIQHHNLPTVQYFRIRFDLNVLNRQEIDHWLRFALEKKVKILVLDLMQYGDKTRENPALNYDLPLPLSSGGMRHFYDSSSNNDIVLEMSSLKRLELFGVNVTELTLKGFLKAAPHLEVLTICGSRLDYRIQVGGRDINLKHFNLVDCSGVESISLYDFDLVSFMHLGGQIEYHFTDLPKLKELEISLVSVGLKDNVFSQISSCVSCLRVLDLDVIDGPEEINVNAIPKFPNVKKLMLTIRATQDDSLLEFTSIAEACPILETIEITLYWFSLVKRRRNVRRTTPHRHEHVKLLKIEGYYGRISDLELVVYVIENAIGLKKIVIDPSCSFAPGDLTAEYKLKREKEARCSAQRQLKSIVPPGVELTIK